MRQGTRTWTIAGTGLILCGVVGMMRFTLYGGSGLAVLTAIADVVWAVAVLLIAIGLSREASVVARRPLGLIALVIVALWPLAATSLGVALSQTDPSGAGAGWQLLTHASLLVPAAAGLIGGVQIARAGVVPAPWRWAPLWVLAAQAAAWALPQILFVALGPDDVPAVAGAFAAIGTLPFLAATVGLGVLALVLAARQRPASVDVFRSA
nr:hypothetical protein [Microbacterium lemovicicum]